MRTLVLLVIGLVLVAVFLRLAGPERRRPAALIFMAAWLTVIGWNFSLGLSHGYSLMEALPIQALLFGVPALAAWWFSRPAPDA